jgi:superfamily I DNA/RNA helicase
MASSSALPADLVARLERLAPDQRAAATAPPGPVLCVAPAGSGKTTTLVARIAWLVGTGADPSAICAITFNRRAAEELQARLAEALAPLGLPADAVRVRTFHALGREILRSAGQAVEPLVDRMAVIREIAPDVGPAGWRRLDDAFSRLKLDLSVTACEIETDPDAGPVARAFVDYEAAVARTGGLDFDDLVVRSLAALEDDEALLARWRERCAHLLVDEVQDVDRSQLRLALLLAAPANRIFLVGDDDQSIYGWRLADVRRVIGLADVLPGLRRVDLTTNYRCPAPVVERSVRLIGCNQERFEKRIVARPSATGRLVLAVDASDETVRIRRVIDTWPADESTRAVLARTNRELLPAVVAALDADIPFRAPEVPLILESPAIDHLLDRTRRTTPDDWPAIARLGAVRRSADAEAVDDGRQAGSARALASDPDEPFAESEVAAALLAWAAPYPDLNALADAIAARRARLDTLRRPDAGLTFATAHSTKGLEFDHVAVIGLEAGRFPSARALADAADPTRALEEERRLAYVAWTRARRSLTLLYDPAVPSPFLLEAFEPDELGGLPAAGLATMPP